MLDDSHGSPQYREVRGRHIPVFAPPKGVAVFDKVRGEDRWTAALFVLRNFVTDALTLLGQGKPLYVAIHERKHERTSWVRSLSLQTTDPEEE